MKIYMNTIQQFITFGNKKNEFNIDKSKEIKIRCKSTKKFNFNLKRNSIKDIDYSFHIKTSDSFNESNSMTKTETKKNMSSSKLDCIYDNELIKGNRNKTMRLFKYIKNTKINENSKSYTKFFRNKINNLSEDLNNDMIKVNEDNGDIMNECKRSSILTFMCFYL